jgi:hypothetical protein
MPELISLRLQRVDKMRMRMAERVDRNASGKIHIALAVLRDEPNAVASLEPERYTGKSCVKRVVCAHGGSFGSE